MTDYEKYKEKLVKARLQDKNWIKKYGAKIRKIIAQSELEVN